MSRRRKYLALVLISVGVVVGQIASDSLFLLVISAILLVSPIINILTAVILARASRRAPWVASLANRADDAVILAFGSIVAAGIGVDVILMLKLGRGPIEDALAIGLLSITLPALSWLQTWQSVWRNGLPADRDSENPIATVERVQDGYHIRVQVDRVPGGAGAPVGEDDDAAGDDGADADVSVTPVAPECGS